MKIVNDSGNGSESPVEPSKSPERSNTHLDPQNAQNEPLNASQTPAKRRAGRPKGAKNKKKMIAIVPTTRAFTKNTRLYVEAFAQMTRKEIDDYCAHAKRITTAEQIALDIVKGALSRDPKSVDRYLKLTTREEPNKQQGNTSEKSGRDFFSNVIDAIEVD